MVVRNKTKRYKNGVITLTEKHIVATPWEQIKQGASVLSVKEIVHIYTPSPNNITLTLLDNKTTTQEDRQEHYNALKRYIELN